MKTFHRICSAILTALSLVWPCGSVLAQTGSSPTITIRATQPQSVSQNISDLFNGRVPATISLRVTVERAGWWFIRFEFNPDMVKLLGDPTGARPVDEVRAGQWYAFKSPFSLTLLVEPIATSPIGVGYLLGRAPDGQRPPDTLESAQQLAQEHNVKIEGKQQYVKLFWPTAQPTIRPEPRQVHFWADRYFEAQPLSLQGDSVGWSFIRLPALPPNLKVGLADTTSLEVVPPAPDGELTSQQWYGFRQVLRLNVALRKPPSSPGDVKLTIESGQAELTTDDRSSTINAIKRDEILPLGSAVVVRVSWEPTSLGAIAKTFFTSGWGVFLFAIVLGLIVGILIRFGVRSFRSRQKRRRESKAQESAGGAQGAGPTSSGSAPTGQVKTGWRSWFPARLPFGRAHRAAANEPPYSELVNRIKVLTPAAGKSSPTQPVTTKLPNTSADLAPSVQLHTKQLREIEQKLIALEGLVLNTYKSKERLAEIEQMLEGRTSPPPDRALEEQIGAQMNRLAEELRTEMGKQAQLVNAQIEGLEQALSQLFSKLREQQAHTDEHRRLLEDYSHQLRQLAPAHPRSDELITDSSGPAGETQDRLYARLLGLIFAGNIEGLNKESFDATVQHAGETLNRFFQDELPLAHNLQDLVAQVKAIVAALEALVSQGSALNKETYGHLRLAAERARRLSREITSLQTQLQNREIQLDLQIRVSTSPGGHAIFLEEMGRAVKQAIDKFTDPQAYIERRLDRLVSEEVIAVADLCDRNIAPPGENEELERLLKELFHAAQLKPILPIPLEPFQPVEHNIVELVPGGRSQAVARVIRRGFYYKDQVLRKADVAVYK